jgi:CBS domain-containing protein
MAATVKEIMNREVFCVGPDAPAGETLHGILSLGITGAPVVDAGHRPLGMVSIRDLIRQPDEAKVSCLMKAPAGVVNLSCSISEVGHRLAESGYHRMVVVDDAGCVAGVVSSLDVVRALLGHPVVHPAAFPHIEPETGLAWTDDVPLVRGKVDTAPEGPGVLVLLFGGAFVPERIVWTESCANVRVRLKEMLSLPQERALAAWLDKRPLRFRVATLEDAAERRRIVELIWRSANPPPPTSVLHSHIRAEPTTRPSPRP